MKKIGYVVLLCACLLVLGGCTSSGPTEVTGPSESNSSNVSKDCPLDFKTLSYGIDMCLDNYGDRVPCCIITNNSPYQILGVEMNWICNGTVTDDVKEHWKNAILSAYGCTSFEELWKALEVEEDEISEYNAEVNLLVSNPSANVRIYDEIAPGESAYNEIDYSLNKDVTDITLMDDLTPDYMMVRFTDENGNSHEATYDFIKGYVIQYE